jgi:DMSO/TMAO reductase YedYZ molybdopterin-dependent catalytic subunit
VAAPPFPGKSPDLISLGDGLNFSAPLEQTPGTLVPNPLFFLRSNHPPAEVAPAAWRLEVGGRVRHPLTLDLAALQRLPTEAHEIWLECAGNSRSRFNPAGEGNQWDEQAISNARFTGVPLRHILAQVEPDAEAIEVVATGADAETFQRGLPLDVARRDGVLLAWEMNDEPIPAANGGPVRLIVPAWPGIASVKWPIRLDVVAEPFRGYWNADRYVMVDAAGSTLGPVREMPVKSVIIAPGADGSFAAGPTTVWGFAWSGHGLITQVDVSIDGQQTWTPARLTPGHDPTSWVRWELDWTARPGPATISVRATDSAGHVQPAAVPWNRFGYQMHAIHTRRLTVQD